MVYRSLRTSAWFAATSFIAIFIAVTGVSAGSQNGQSVFRIVGPGAGRIVLRDITQPTGVLITDVSGSPLLRVGDVIVAVNGNPVTCLNEFNMQDRKSTRLNSSH